MAVDSRTEPRARRRGLAIGLVLLAPFVGEFVLGNTPITQLPMLLVFTPMYGAGALLIRESARRLGAGWPSIVLLGAAYALVEEGVVDMMLFNPAYLGADSFDGQAPIPALGLSSSLTYASLSIHTVWSVCVPIAIMEAFDRREPRPWLGRLGLTVTAAVFVLGCAALTVVQYDRFRFLASPLQLAVTAAAVVALVVAAVTVARRPRATTPSGSPAPRPAVAAASAFGLSSLYWLVDLFVNGLLGAWVAVGAWAVLAAGCAILLARCSGRPGWGRSHRLAVAGGALLTYVVWVSFANTLFTRGPDPLGLLGNVVTGVVAAGVLALAVRSETRDRPAAGPRPSREIDCEARRRTACTSTSAPPTSRRR